MYINKINSKILIYKNHNVSFCSLGKNKIHNLPLSQKYTNIEGIVLTNTIFRDLLKLNVEDESNPMYFGYFQDDFANFTFNDFHLRKFPDGYLKQAVGDEFVKQALKSTDEAIEFFNVLCSDLVGLEVPNRKTELLVEFFVIEYFTQFNLCEGEEGIFYDFDDYFNSLGDSYRPNIYIGNNHIHNYSFKNEWMEYKEILFSKIEK